MPTIIVRIPKDQPMTVTVQGVAGPGCKDLTQALEKALGKVTDDRKTRDFQAPASQEVARDQDA